MLLDVVDLLNSDHRGGNGYDLVVSTNTHGSLDPLDFDFDPFNLDKVFSAIEDAMTQKSPKPVASSAHPCSSEVKHCINDNGPSTRYEITECLVEHYESLSSECKCFLHQTISPEQKSKLPH